MTYSGASAKRPFVCYHCVCHERNLALQHISRWQNVEKSIGKPETSETELTKYPAKKKTKGDLHLRGEEHLQAVVCFIKERTSAAFIGPLWTLHFASELLSQVVVAERLKRWTRNPLGSNRAGSNPVDYLHFSIVLAFKKKC